VAVARAVSWGKRVVIMDEPTAALGVKESGMVLELIRAVKARGVPVILISHNLPHVFEVADRIQVRLESLKSQKPDQVRVDKAHCFVGLDAYQHVIDSVDVVLIANAAKFQPMQLTAAVQAGKHAFVEKPHAIDPVGVRQSLAACELAGQKKLSVLSGLQSRHHASIQETIKRVQDGQIGQIVSMEENFIRPPYGRTDRHKDLPEIQIQYGNQYRFGWLCGDDVPQSLVHNIDRATWAMNETPPERCHGLGGRSSGAEFRLLGDVFDHHSVVYQYKNGVRLYALCRTTPGCYNENSSIILGSKGQAFPLTGTITGENPWRYKGPRTSPYVDEHKAFFRAIRSGEPINSGDYMTRATLICIMGQLSCYSGQQITWDQINQSQFQFLPPPEDCTWDMEPPVKPDVNGVYPVPVPGQMKIA